MRSDGLKWARQNPQFVRLTIYGLLILQICFFEHEPIMHSANGAKSPLANPMKCSHALSAELCLFFLLSIWSVSCRLHVPHQRPEVGKQSCSLTKKNPLQSRTERTRWAPTSGMSGPLFFSLKIHTAMFSLLGKQRKQDKRLGRERMLECHSQKGCRGHFASLPKCQSYLPYSYLILLFTSSLPLNNPLIWLHLTSFLAIDQ